MNNDMTGNCRLCNYSSDNRLMMKIFDEQSGYQDKIENYLSIKLSQNDEKSSYICFHCSQQLDNFHSFASKINQIQKVLYPIDETEIQQQTQEETSYAYEITIIPTKDDEILATVTENDAQIPYKFTTIKTKSQPTMTAEEQENSFNKLKSVPIKSQQKCQESEMVEILREEDTMDEFMDEDTKFSKIPKKLIANGQLIYKGKKLMEMMSNFYSTICEDCNLNFQSISDLFEHQKSLHGIEPFVNCCSTNFTKFPRIIWHFAKHIQPEAFKCPICEYTVSRPKFLEFHMRTHSDQRPFACDHCDKTFIWKGALKSHLLNYHLKTAEKKNYICTICMRKYATPGSLASHKKSAHKPKQRNLCEICSKSFATATSYKEHLITHSENYDKLQLKCSECNKWLKNLRCLKSHMATHSSLTYNCTSCDYTTKKENLLKNHIITQHTSDRPFSCDECDKTFKVKRHLTVHKTQSHAGTKNAKVCEFCGREFNSSSNYYTHRKTIHANELSQVIEKKKKESQQKRIEIGLESD